MPSNSLSTIATTTRLQPDVLQARRLAGQVEAHATALRSWAGILLTRLHSPKPMHSGTAQMIADIAAAMEHEASVAAGLARKLQKECGS
jgi:hypothetical protein